jgi:hypothetical protein
MLAVAALHRWGDLSADSSSRVPLATIIFMPRTCKPAWGGGQHATTIEGGGLKVKLLGGVMRPTSR